MGVIYPSILGKTINHNYNRGFPIRTFNFNIKVIENVEGV